MSQTRATGLNTRRGHNGGCAARGGFSLIDLLVSMGVVAILIALLMPSLATVREAARKVVCASNVRQIGLGLAMYADDHRGLLPYTKFASDDPARAQSQSMMMLRTADAIDAWDGLGDLYYLGYLDAAGVFYCPSHHGAHPLAAYSRQWTGEGGDIFANYHYRGFGAVTIDSFRSSQALVADGMRLRSDYNHKVGTNVLHANLAVGWRADPNREIASRLPETADDPAAAQKVDQAWDILDSQSQNR